MARTFKKQVEGLYEVFGTLAREVQARDRASICCHGISVSQCYALKALHEGRGMTISELAGRLRLDVSSTTRAVDGLVSKGLVRRLADLEDRRARRACATAKGRALTQRIRSESLAQLETILRKVPAASRESAIAVLADLAEAVASTGQSTCKPEQGSR